jgi:phage gp29-like protein
MTYGWQWMMQTAQIFGIPFRWATYDTSQVGLVDKVAEMLQNLGSAGWAAFPAGTTLDFKEAVTNARDNPQALIIELAKQACDLTILHQELSSESKAAGLGSGNALLQGSVRQDVLHGAAHWTADLLNYQLVPGVLRLNYGETSEPPAISPDLSIEPDPKQLADRDTELAQNTTVAFPKKWFLERHGIPAPAEGEEVITGKQAGSLLGNPDPDNDDEPPGPKDEKDGKDKTDVAAKAFLTAALEAKAHDQVADKLVDNVLEDLTGVEAKWLGAVKPFFRHLVEAARSENLTDAQFIAVLERAQKQMPELFTQLNHQALADTLEAAMGAACVNGAVQGFMKRKPKTH